MKPSTFFTTADSEQTDSEQTTDSHNLQQTEWPESSPSRAPINPGLCTR